MGDPRNIMPAIDLLIHAKAGKPFPRWIRWADITITALYACAWIWALYTLATWL